MQEPDTAAVEPDPKILVVIRRKFVLSVQSDFIEHSSEVNKTADLVGAGAQAGHFYPLFSKCIDA